VLSPHAAKTLSEGGKQQMLSRVCLASAQRVSPYEAWPLRCSGTITGSCRDIELDSEHVSTLSFPLLIPSTGSLNPSCLDFSTWSDVWLDRMTGRLHPGGSCGCWNRGIDSDRPCCDVHFAVSRLFRSQMGTWDSRMGIQPKALGVAVLIFFTNVKGDRQDRHTARGWQPPDSTSR